MICDHVELFEFHFFFFKLQHKYLKQVSKTVIWNLFSGDYLSLLKFWCDLPHQNTFMGSNPLQPDVGYLYPLKTSENLPKDFLMFSEGIDKQHRAVMG